MSNALYSLRYSTLNNREIFSYAKTLYHFSVNRLDFLNVTQVKQIYKCSSYKMKLLGSLSQIHMNDSGKVMQWSWNVYNNKGVVFRVSLIRPVFKRKEEKMIKKKEEKRKENRRKDKKKKKILFLFMSLA